MYALLCNVRMQEYRIKELNIKEVNVYLHDILN